MRFYAVVDNHSGTSFDSTRAVKRVDSPARHYISEHGLSLLIETDAGKRILFDAGASEMIFLNNLDLLGFKPQDIDMAFISHGHYDHMGGLKSLIDAGVPIYTHPSTFSCKKYALLPDGTKKDIGPSEEMMQMVKGAKINYISASTEISPGVKTSGDIPRIFPYEMENKFGREDNGQIILDNMLEEQALFISSKKGLVIATGCGHPGVTNMVQLAKKSFNKNVYMVIGGFHLSGAPANNERILKTMENLKNLGIDRIAPMHCTGFTGTKMLSDRFVGMDLMTSGSQVEIL